MPNTTVCQVLDSNYPIITRNVLCKHSNGERASLANIKLTIDRLFVGMLLVNRLSFFSLSKPYLITCLNLGDFLVDSLGLVDRLL